METQQMQMEKPKQKAGGPSLQDQMKQQSQEQCGAEIVPLIKGQYYGTVNGATYSLSYNSAASLGIIKCTKPKGHEDKHEARNIERVIKLNLIVWD